MPPHRKIIFSLACDASVMRLGGYRAVDRVLDGILDALARNPYGFKLVESDWFRCRYAITRPVGGVPGLVWYFTIKRDSVTIEDVEPLDEY
jgi:hypothetical protein